MKRLVINSLLILALTGCASASKQADNPASAPASESDAQFGERVLKDADYLAFIMAEVIETTLDGRQEEYIYTLSGFLFKHSDGQYYVGGAGHIQSSPKLQIKKILVWFKKDGLPFFADLVGYDLNYDCSILKLRDKNFYFDGRLAVFGDSSKLQRNQRVAALGAPLGKPNQVGVGRILQPSDTIYSQRNKTVRIFVHDCPTQSGNSGGPIVNKTGEVIGIHVMSERETNKRFAIPINDFKARLEDLINGFRRDRYHQLADQYYTDM